MSAEANLLLARRKNYQLKEQIVTKAFDSWQFGCAKSILCLVNSFWSICVPRTSLVCMEQPWYLPFTNSARPHSKKPHGREGTTSSRKQVTHSPCYPAIWCYLSTVHIDQNWSRVSMWRFRFFASVAKILRFPFANTLTKIKRKFIRTEQLWILILANQPH